MYGKWSLIFGQTLQLNLYSEEYLKKLFTDVFAVTVTEKVIVVCSFLSDKGERYFGTYTLDTFRANIESFMENGSLRLDDPNFIDQSNVLDNISDAPGNYSPHST